jgi:streptogramin lyase
MCRVLAAIAVLVTLALPPAARAFAVQDFLTPPDAAPRAVLAGPLSSMWFSTGNAIGRMDKTGHVTLYRRGLPAGAGVEGLAMGADGNVWFADYGTGDIGRVTPAGVITEFASGLDLQHGESAAGVALGPDGNIWFVDRAAHHAGRITPDGQVKLFTLPPLSALESGYPGRDGLIAAGGRLWFPFGSSLAAMTTEGQVTTVPLGLDFPTALARGRDGTFWVGTVGGQIAQVAPSGEVTLVPGLRLGYVPTLVAGPRNHVWTVDAEQDQILEIDRSGRVVRHLHGRPNAFSGSGRGLDALAMGHDGHLWATEFGLSALGRVTVGATCSVPRLGGLTRQASLTALRAWGCAPARIRHAGPGARVVAQSPRAGLVLPHRAGVQLTLGRPRPACPFPEHARVLAHSVDATVVRYGRAGVDQDHSWTAIAGCARRTHRLVELARSDNAGDGGSSIEILTVTGTWVAYSRFDTFSHYGDGAIRLLRDNLSSAGPPSVVSSVEIRGDNAKQPLAVAINARGVVAWVDGGYFYGTQQLHLLGRTASIRDLDEGAFGSLTDLAVSDTAVTWRHDGQPRSEPIS